MNGVVGSAVSRKDGYLKVTGKARYAADHPMRNVAHAVAVCSTVANGQITNIESSAAEKSPGFLAILHHGNVPKLFRPVNNFMSASKPGEIRVVFEDDRIHYYGQYIALVVADTLQQAQHAASLVRITYKTENPVVETEQAKHTLYDPAEFFGEKLKAERGKPAARFKDAPVTYEADYFTPTEHHNPMEPCASIAAWEGDKVTLWETTQWVAGARNTIAETLGIANERVHIISPFIGGGFGCKGFIWPHSVMSAVAAKKLGRPVKLSLTRKQMFSGAGHRSETWQKIRLGATKEGKLTAMQHETMVQTSTIDEFVEACGTPTRFLYSCENVGITHHAVRVNIATPTPMRAPGENPGLFALESALDELAYKLNIDPVRLRIINYSDKNEHTNQPWSSKYLKECYEVAGEKFGWARRDPHPRSMRDGKYLVGWGMASATYPGMRSSGAAKVRILQDGSAQVVSATQDMGGGTYTTMTQIVSDVTGIPVERIHPALGDSHLPPAPVSGGSMTTASVLPAVQQAATEALKKLVQLAIAGEKSSLHGKKEDEVVAAKGKVYVKGSAPESGISYQQVLSASNQAAAEGESFMQPGKERETYAFQSWGVQFVEVKVDPEIAKVKVSRVVSAFDIGRVINRKTAESQAYSGIIMGIGMALMEHTVYDHRDGGIINSNLADYAMPVNADVNSIDVHFIDKPDPYIDPFIGARGVGEITVTGVAPAIANAIFHATGQRLRELPITPDKLL